MGFVINLSLGKKLALLLLMPLSAIVFFVFQGVRGDLSAIDEAKAVATMPPYFEATSNLVGSLQSERGSSAGFISSGGKKFGPELDAKRKATDDALARLEAQHATLKADTFPSLVAFVDTVLARADEVVSIRKRVSRQAVSAPEVMSSYSGIIGAVLSDVGAMRKDANSSTSALSITGFQTILNIKEAAGIERALLVSTFAAKDLPSDRFEDILNKITTQEANISNFLSGAPKSQSSSLSQALESDGYRRALAARKLVLDIGHGQASLDRLTQDPIQVFADQTVKLEELGRVEGVLAEDLIAYAEYRSDSAWGHFTVTVVEGIVVLIVTVLFAVFLVRLILANVGEAVSAAQRVGEGNLSVQIKARGDDEIGQVLSNLSSTQDRLSSVICDIQTASLELDTGVNEIASGNQDLSERTQQQARSLEEITKKMQALSEVVNNSTKQQVEGDQLAKQAFELTTGCSDMVGQLYLSMQEIRESSKNIMTITSVIDEIAFQTNLLSLNAAVEAARAGEQGKGFAVVAAEVRQLAQRSSSAASEINDLIDTGVEKVNKGGDLAETARNALNDVQESVRSVSEVMRELSSNSQAQADDIVEISDMVSDIDSVTQRNAALVEEVAAASETLGQHSSELSKVTRYFQLAG